MNFLLIIRTECICILILLFLLYTGIKYWRSSTRKHFLNICSFAIWHCIFDIITVYTVNHTDIVPSWLNRILHGVFYLSAILTCYEFFCYVIHDMFPAKFEKKVSRAAFALPAAYAVLMPFLPIEYLNGNGTNYSYGPCAFAGYTVAGLFFIAGGVLILKNRHMLPPESKKALFPILGLVISIIILQILIPELLFTGAGVTLLTVGIYFAAENPTEQFIKRAYYDLDTRIKNRNSYDEDLEMISRKQHHANAPKSVSYVICDLNDLKKTNDRYGHSVGDELIRLAAQSLRENMVHAYSVYRIGGDEFAAVYIDTAEDIIQQEIEEVRAFCTQQVTSAGSPLSMAIGYAVTDDTHGLEDIILIADRRMYADKTHIKKKA